MSSNNCISRRSCSRRQGARTGLAEYGQRAASGASRTSAAGPDCLERLTLAPGARAARSLAIFRAGAEFQSHECTTGCNLRITSE
jgi:hypothetical protein